jgi:hypothetical protein
VSILNDLAHLRPMMPFAQLSELIGAEWQPSPTGWLSERLRFAARVDTEGKIGRLAFDKDFPSTISIGDLHVGMNLDDLLASRYGFSAVLPRPYPFDETKYNGRTDVGDDITARVKKNGIVRTLELSRPGRTYPDDEGRPNHEHHPEDHRRWPTLINISPCSYPDPSEMLFDWAHGHSLTEYHDSFPAFAKWLEEQSTPDDWHRFVARWIWDLGVAPPLWIVQQKECDVATALTIFYANHPSQLLRERNKISRYRLDYFDLLHEIRRRCIDGFYTRSTLAFDRAVNCFWQGRLGEIADEATVQRAIPEAMRAVIPGRVLPKAPDIEAWNFKPLNPRRASTVVPPPVTEEELLDLRRIKERAKAR